MPCLPSPQDRGREVTELDPGGDDSSTTLVTEVPNAPLPVGRGRYKGPAKLVRAANLPNIFLALDDRVVLAVLGAGDDFVLRWHLFSLQLSILGVQRLGHTEDPNIGR